MNTNQTLCTCAVCNQTGKVGAKWLLYIDGQSQPRKVHKPCGEMLLKSAPEGVKARLVPSRELREEWRERRLAANFWDNAFKNAKPLKPTAASVAKARPVLMTVTTPPPATVVPEEAAV